MALAETHSETSAASVVNGRAEVVWRADGTVTRLARLYQHDPIRVLFPQPAAGDPATAAITNTAGGCVGGDRITFHARVEAGAEALIAQQAAEKIYRSTGATTTVDVHLRAAPRATLEWLPQETILFDTARLRRRTTLDVVGDGRVMAGEILVFGRRAMAETFTAGLAREVWEVRRDGRLSWLDAMHLADDVAAVLAAPAGFDGAAATATALYVGADAADKLETARACLPKTAGVRTGATVVNGVLVMRWLGREAAALRQSFGQFWADFRASALGRPARLPRLWHI